TLFSLVESVQLVDQLENEHSTSVTSPIPLSTLALPTASISSNNTRHAFFVRTITNSYRTCWRLLTRAAAPHGGNLDSEVAYGLQERSFDVLAQLLDVLGASSDVGVGDIRLLFDLDIGGRYSLGHVDDELGHLLDVDHVSVCRRRCRKVRVGQGSQCRISSLQTGH
ncbi:hypothetical protein PFISCL1PPCAC_28554, partial [Pristionchus fissidentatus]